MNFPKHSHPNNCFWDLSKELDGSCPRLWGFSTTSRKSWVIWVDDVYPKIMTSFKKVILGVFSAQKAASQLGGWKVCFSKLSCFCSAMQAPRPNKKSRENRKYQPFKHQIMDWFVQDLCCPRTLPSRLVLGAFVLWLGVDAVFVLLFGAGSISCSVPLVRPSVNYPLYLVWYIIHTYRCIFEMIHLYVNIH